MGTMDSQPLSLVLIPGIGELRERLGFSASPSTGHAALTTATRDWCKEYQSPDGTPAEDLTDWRSTDVQSKLSLLTEDFLEKGGYGRLLWAPQYPPKIPEWPRDKARIFEHLRQLFWRQNLNESRRNSKSKDRHRVADENIPNNHRAGAETEKSTINIADFVEKYKQGRIGPHRASSSLSVHPPLAPCFDASPSSPRSFRHHDILLGLQHGLPRSSWDAPHSTATNCSMNSTSEHQNPGVDPTQYRSPSESLNCMGETPGFYGSEQGENEHQVPTKIVVLKYNAQKYRALMAKMIQEDVSVARVKAKEGIPATKGPQHDESTRLGLPDKDERDDDEEDYTPVTSSNRKRIASQKSNIDPTKSKSAKNRPHFASPEQDRSQWHSEGTINGRCKKEISESPSETSPTKLNDAAKKRGRPRKVTPAESSPEACPDPGPSSRSAALGDSLSAESSQPGHPTTMDPPTDQSPTCQAQAERPPTEHLVAVHTARENLLSESRGLPNSLTENPLANTSSMQNPPTTEHQAFSLLAQNRSAEIPPPSRPIDAANWQQPVGQHGQAAISHNVERSSDASHPTTLPNPITPEEVRESQATSSAGSISRSWKQADASGSKENCPPSNPVARIPGIRKTPRPGPRPRVQIRCWLRTPTLEERLKGFSINGKTLDVLFDDVSALTLREDITTITLRLKTKSGDIKQALSRDDFDEYAYLKKIFVDKIKVDRKKSGNTVFEVSLEPDAVDQQDTAVDGEDESDFDLT